ncbi:Sugar diacid utilization regulator [Streptacidiphilus jiangxiensis]|uniref:Sugar diacid utilization regulator n=1 Tax=Streptacidiphilus jiangxiensis TaxID=235985 RepID=A0A1H7SI67_STRJI|nr:Sugar diacid utilization regulator [Streptacidiphilus jiangxiensis]
MRLGELLAERGLGLRALTDVSGTGRSVSWAVPSELADPTPWLDGGELVLTTGLRLRSRAAQEAFVDRLVLARAGGVGFGTGLGHDRVPRALLARARQSALPVLEVPYETPFVALVRFCAERLAQERATATDLSGRRELLGRVLAEVLSGGFDEPTAERVLACHDVDLGRPHRVVLGTWAAAGRQAEARLAALPCRRVGAVFEGALLVVAPATSAEETAVELREVLARDPLHGAEAQVAVGPSGVGVRGLRAGCAAAREALERGRREAPDAPRLAELLATQGDPSVRQFGRRLLEPLVRFDSEHRADLVGTLRRYLETDGSVQATAEGLFVHRNTVRYRLARIEELTNRSLAATADRAELWLALAVAG